MTADAERREYEVWLAEIERRLLAARTECEWRAWLRERARVWEILGLD